MAAGYWEFSGKGLDVRGMGGWCRRGGPVGESYWQRSDLADAITKARIL